MATSTSSASESNPSSMQADDNAEQYLTFMLGGEEYGVDILRVQGIQGWDEVTPIPNTPSYLLGVINLRGTVVPIVDLRKRFEMPEPEYGKTTVVIVVRVEGAEKDRTVGMVVDGVSEVYNVDRESAKPPPDLGDGMNTDFVKGLATVDDKMIILLEVDRLINEGVMDYVDVPASEPEAASR